MGFASYLEDITDRYDESYGGGSRTVSPGTRPVWRDEISRVRGWAAHVGQEPTKRDIEEATYLFGELFGRPKRLIADFVSFYQQHEPLTRLPEDKWDRHLQGIKLIHDTLEPISNQSPAADHWAAVREIRTQLRSVLNDVTVFGPFSRSTIQTVRDLTKDLFRRCDAVKQELRRFNDIIRAVPVKAHEKLQLHEATNQLNAISDRLNRDLNQLGQHQSLLKDVERWWDVFLERFTLLAVQQNYRPTLQDLDRLSLNEAQERYVALDHDGCYRLQGASGSGKTIILIHRALRLAHENPNSTVRVFTINRTLAELLQSTARTIHGRLPGNLHISAFYDFLIQAVSLFEPPARYRLVDHRSGERIPTSWLEFYRHKNNVFASNEVKDLVRWVERRNEAKRRIDACRYLRDEVVYIQSAYRKDERHRYLEDPRRSRSIRLLSNERKLCLDIVKAWEEWLSVGCLCDIDGLTLRAVRHFDNPIASATLRAKLPTNHILVDEVQDFSTIELRLLKQLVEDAESKNSHFFVGDLHQRVYSKHQDTKVAGYDFRGRAGILRRNYRNTRQILQAAFNLPQSFPPREDSEESIEVHDPELSAYQGDRPIILKCASRTQINRILDIIKHRKDRKVAVISENENLLHQIWQEAKQLGFNGFELIRNDELDRWRNQGDVLSSSLVFSRLEPVKGFEFDTVILCDLSDGVFPRQLTPEEEHWRQAAVLYSTLTRARDELIMTYEQEPSRFLTAMLSDVDNHDLPDDAMLSKALFAS